MILKKIKSRNGFIAICRCNLCGKEFKRNYYIVKKMKNHYCNRNCMAIYFKKFYVGKNNPNYGRKFSEEQIKKMMRARMRTLNNSNSSDWSVGIKINRKRVYILIKNHPYCNKQGYVLRSRLIMEKKLNRYLTNKEIVHHINGNVSDDDIKNLELTTNEEHSRYHTQLRWDKKIFVRNCQMLRNKEGKFIGKKKDQMQII